MCAFFNVDVLYTYEVHHRFYFFDISMQTLYNTTLFIFAGLDAATKWVPAYS
jgi:hypothetical protein